MQSVLKLLGNKLTKLFLYRLDAKENCRNILALGSQNVGIKYKSVLLSLLMFHCNRLSFHYLVQPFMTNYSGQKLLAGRIFWIYNSFFTRMIFFGFTKTLSF